MTANDERLFPQEHVAFTCLSCSIVFPSAEAQREHYRSDHHRYNMKRRVGSLPPVTSTVFNQKVLDRRQETIIMASASGPVCKACNKAYATENAYRSHLNSKKHRDNELRVKQGRTNIRTREPPKTEAATSLVNGTSEPLLKDGAGVNSTEDDTQKMIDEKIAAARSRLSIEHCLFCPVLSTSLEENLSHMTLAHSFFVPDTEYLVDMAGLITYLGEKIAVGNICIFCNLKSREFRSIEAVRKHMVDKSHCKIAYDLEKDRLEMSKYYDFSPSYPDYKERKAKGRKANTGKNTVADSGLNDEWEDIENEDSAEVDEVVDEDTSSVPPSEEEDGDREDLSSDSDDGSVPDNRLTYGDTVYELVLPSGARIGHREMRRYYAQSYPRTSLAARNGQDDDSKSGAALVRRLLADKNSAIVPRKGGFGAFGGGTDVVKARNRGEASEAGRHIREFRDQKRKEEFKTRIAFNHNYQKHYRDPLLQ